MTEHEASWPLSLHARRRARRSSHARRRIDGAIAARWLLPFAALVAPAFGDAAGEYLLGCLLFGAALSLWGARRTGAVWWIMLWSLVTGAFAALLLLIEVPALPSLTMVVVGTAAVQAVGLLGVGAPASAAAWSARRMLLLSLAGPLALALLAARSAYVPGGFVPAVAVCLDLTALPLALLARQRAQS